MGLLRLTYAEPSGLFYNLYYDVKKKMFHRRNKILQLRHNTHLFVRFKFVTFEFFLSLKGNFLENYFGQFLKVCKVFYNLGYHVGVLKAEVEVRLTDILFKFNQLWDYLDIDVGCDVISSTRSQYYWRNLSTVRST